MFCRNFDDTKKRCQEACCDRCRHKAMEVGDPYEPLIEAGGLGIDH